jgi:hypothetical protein
MSPYAMDHVKESPSSILSARYYLAAGKTRMMNQHDVSTQRQQTRVVAFASLCHKIDIPSRTTLSIEQRQDLWWSRREIKEIRESEHNTKRSNSRWGEDKENYDDEDDDDCCIFTRFGVHTPFQEERRYKRIQKCRHAVLLELERQQSQHLSLPNLICIASRRCSRPSREDAQSRGMSLAVSMGHHPQPQQQQRQQQQQQQDEYCPKLQHSLKPDLKKDKKTRQLISLSPPRSPIRKAEITTDRQ